MSQLNNVLTASVPFLAGDSAFAAQPGVKTNTAQFLGALEGNRPASIGRGQCTRRCPSRVRTDFRTLKKILADYQRAVLSI